MLTVKQCRNIDPELATISDEELGAVLEQLYGLGNMAFDLWAAARDGVSKYPLGVQKEGLLPGKVGEKI